MINETPSGQVQYEGDTSTLDWEDYDLAKHKKIEEIKDDILSNRDYQLFLKVISEEDDKILNNVMRCFFATASQEHLMQVLKDAFFKIDAYVELEYPNFDPVTKELY